MDGLIALALAKGYTNERIAAMGQTISFKGMVDTYNDLPATGNKVGDLWGVREKKAEYIWVKDGSTEKWELFGDVRSTNKAFASEWVINSTCAVFCDQVAADATVMIGDVYIGGVEFTDLPDSLSNGEAAVSVFNSTLGGKMIHIDLYSSTTSPYYWSCNYYNNSCTPWVKQIADVKVDGTSVVTNGVANIDLTGKQDKLTAGDGISINDTTISVSSTIAKKEDLSDFRGNWNTWDVVPTDSSLYPADSTGSKIPTTNDYIVVKDASGYAPLTKKCVITKAASSYTFVVTYPDSTTSSVTLSNEVSGTLGKDNEFILTAGASTVHSISCIYNTLYNGTVYNAETAITNTYYYNEFRAEIYLPEAYMGTWQFKYIGTWDTDGKNGWKPEYQPLWKDAKNVSVSSTSTSSTPTDVRYITIDGTESRLASVALRAMKSGWKPSTLTTAQAATAILDDADVVEGDGFLGTVYWSDLPIPEGPGRQAEVKAFILKKNGTTKIVQFECTSGTTAPYAWFFNSYEGKWRGYVPINNTLTSTSTNEALSAKQGKELNDSKQGKLTAGANITIDENNVISSTVQYITLDATATSGTLTDEQQQLLMDGANVQFIRDNLNYSFETSYGSTRPFAVYSSLKDSVYSVIEIDVFNKTWNYTQREFQKKLTAGTNITIDENNVISATGGGGGGSITDVKFNNTSVVSEGVANIIVNPNPTTSTSDPLLESVTIGTQKYRIPAGGGGGITVDNTLSPTSENPVQNKIVTDAIGYKASNQYVNEKVADLNSKIDNKITRPTGGSNGYVLTKTLSGEAWQKVDALPEGGTTGQVLTKTATSASWQDINALPEGGSVGQILTKTSTGSSWQNAPTEIPSSGTQGQVLTKTQSGFSWQNVPTELPSGGQAGDLLQMSATGPVWSSVIEGLSELVEQKVAEYMQANYENGDTKEF